MDQKPVKTRKKRIIKHLIMKDQEGIFFIKRDFFEGIQSRNEALVIAMRVYDEINNSLLREYDEGGDLLIRNISVVDGLKNCLDELEKAYPCLMFELLSQKRYIDGKVIANKA